MLKQVVIAQLKPGMMVTRVVEQNGPVKIRRVGMVKSFAMVKGLTEMGVSLVEVDEAQSVSLEDDVVVNSAAFAQASPSHQEINESATTLTPTQRLMEKDKQSAMADRQLSQQFHRSLFMPAIDEMPSKWRLFVQPYVILLVVLISGFGIGLGVMSAANWVQTASLQSAKVPIVISEQEQALASPPNEGTSQSLNPQQIRQTPALNRDIPATNGQDSQANGQLNQSADELISEPEVNATQNAEPAPVRSFESINGVVLNEGETVLGYGAGLPSQPSNSSASNGSNELSQPADTQQQNAQQNSSAQASGSISSDLLRRVNQAAAQIEAEDDVDTLVPAPNFEENILSQTQAAPQGRVFDLTREPKTMPRIDQLPSGTLIDMPAMSFSAHMYASNPMDRWVRVNGKRLSEGDLIADGLSIVEIESERIILSFRGETFSMNALSDW
jgi:general secretion pathway protein B